VLAGLWLGAVLTAGCAKQAPATSQAPGDAGAMDSASAEASTDEEVMGDPLLGPLSELEAREDELMEAGVDLPGDVQQERALSGKSSAVPAGAGEGVGRCQRIRDLATNICTLRDQICELADAHDDDRRYESACERASLDCDRATEASDGCSDA